MYKIVDIGISEKLYHLLYERKEYIEVIGFMYTKSMDFKVIIQITRYMQYY